MRDERQSSAERLLAASEFPEADRTWIDALISGLDLGIDETYDVASELIAHFEDGLSAGRPPAELLASFGDEHTVLGLIRKAKRRR